MFFGAMLVLAYSFFRYGFIIAGCVGGFMAWAFVGVYFETSGWTLLKLLRFHIFVVLGSLWFGRLIVELDRMKRGGPFPREWASCFGGLLVLDSLVSYIIRNVRMRNDKFQGKPVGWNQFWLRGKLISIPSKFESSLDAERKSRRRLITKTVLGLLLVVLPFVIPFGRR
jgi:hypothetical protein